jgi:hypothetical protein
MNDNLRAKAGRMNYLRSISLQELTNSTYVDVKTKFTSVMLVGMSEGWMDE